MSLKVNHLQLIPLIMSLDFPYTCTKINRAINDVIFIIEDYIKDYIRYLCPDMPEKRIYELARDWSKEMYQAMSMAFDMVKDTNISMRKQADYQIGMLESEIEKLKSQIERK